MKRNRPLHDFEIGIIFALSLIILISIASIICLWTMKATYGNLDYVPLYVKIISTLYLGIVAVMFIILIIHIWRKGL